MFVSLLSANRGSLLIAIAIAVVGTLRFARWAVEFVCARADVGHARLGDRLKHVELELALQREATALLFGALADRDPVNPALRDVASILRRAVPLEKSAEDLANLLEQLRNVPGTRGRNR
jgi:hypothetical protein